MSKICVICQPKGIGDILFLQKFAHIQKDKGYEVFWPVINEFKWIGDYIPYFNFIPLNEGEKWSFRGEGIVDNALIFTDNFIFYDVYHHIPINEDRKVMADKYKCISMDFKDWMYYVKFNRNKEKENQLFYDVLKLKDKEPYIFVNKYYNTIPEYLNKVIIPNYLPFVELKIMKEFSMFDWCKVIENATEIHMVETSLWVMMESPIVRLSAKKMVLYSRHKTNDFSDVDYLFNLKWEFKK